MFIESLGDALSLQQPISKLVGGVSLAQSIVDDAVAFLRRMAVKSVNGGQMEIMQNKFIAYLNSLHNLKASGAKAPAESQALGPYFGELYEPFPLVDRLVEALTDKVKRVVVLRDAMHLICDAEYS